MFKALESAEQRRKVRKALLVLLRNQAAEGVSYADEIQEGIYWCYELMEELADIDTGVSAQSGE